MFQTIKDEIQLSHQDELVLGLNPKNKFHVEWKPLVVCFSGFNSAQKKEYAQQVLSIGYNYPLSFSP